MTSQSEGGLARPLDGKVAIVTGAGSGLGVGIARALADAGACVALAGLDLADLEHVRDCIIDSGGKAIAGFCDVTDRQQVKEFVDRTATEVGAPWVLVNNAIGMTRRPLQEMEDSDLDLPIRSGIYGSVYMMQACFPMMRLSGGRIINLGSGAATMGLNSSPSYVIAKEGIRGLTKTAATAWGRFGITVNTVCPMAETPLFASYWDTLTDRQKAEELEQIPLRRMGDGQHDVGATIVFLAGPGGSYITSRTLHVDGGRSFYDR